MKKTLIFSLIACLSLAVVSCEDPAQIWEDNANPEVFIPRYGYTSTTVWDQTSGTFDTYLGVYCGGLRPANQVNTINVNYAIDDAMIDAYNADETSQYGGEVVALPKDCYTLKSTTATIEAGEVDAQIPVSFDIAKVKAAIAANPGKRLVIPFKLTGTSLYQLSADESLTKCLMEVDIQEPTFYFFCNNYGVVPQAAKLIFGEDGNYKFDVMGNGVPDGNYTITFALDEDALNEAFPGSNMIPADAVVLKETSTYQNKVDHAFLEFTLLSEKLEFFKTYYLPVTIKAASEYAGDKEIGKFFMTVEMKNEFEKAYQSDLTVEAQNIDRTASYSTKKNAATYASDILEIQMVMNNTIAGAKNVASTSATTYNNRYVRIKVIPTADKNHYDIEYVPVTDRSTKQNTPDTFEAVPGAENYYDWNMERFVLNYRFKHIEKKDTSWVIVKEILQAL